MLLGADDQRETRCPPNPQLPALSSQSKTRAKCIWSAGLLRRVREAVLEGVWGGRGQAPHVRASAHSLDRRQLLNGVFRGEEGFMVEVRSPEVWEQ